MKQFHAVINIEDEEVLLGSSGQPTVEEALLQELGWLHDSGLSVDLIPEHEKELKSGFILSCTHDHRFGTDQYVSFHTTQEDARRAVEAVAKDCEYDEEDDRESFAYEIEEVIIDPSALSAATKEQEQLYLKTQQATCGIFVSVVRCGENTIKKIDFAKLQPGDTVFANGEPIVVGPDGVKYTGDASHHRFQVTSDVPDIWYPEELESDIKPYGEYLVASVPIGSQFITGATMIQKNDALDFLGIVEDDTAAWRLAKRDGVRTIENILGIPEGQYYVDTEFNRECILHALGDDPELLANGENAIPYIKLTKAQKMRVDSDRPSVRYRAVLKGYGLDRLMYDPSGHVRAAVAFQGYGLHALCMDYDTEVRECCVAGAAARGCNDVLEHLIKDNDWTVRQEVALSGYGAETLKEDDSPAVRLAAVSQDNEKLLNERVASAEAYLKNTEKAIDEKKTLEIERS